MVYSSVDAYRPAQAWLYPDDMNDEYSMSHWQNHFIGHEPPLDMYYNPSGRQLAHSHHDYHDHLGGSLPYAVQGEFTPVFYHSAPQDLHHPYYNSPSTLCDSSSASSGTLSPLIETRATSLLPSSDYNDCGAATCGYGPHGCDTSDEAYADTSCITMQIVQKTADTLHDEPAGSFDTYVNHEPQELVFAEPSHDDPTPSKYDQDSITVAHVERRNEMTPETEQDAACESETASEYEPQPAPAVRRRRAPAQQSRPATLGRSRITKTSSPGRQRSSPAKPSSSNQDSTRAFLCPLAPYGCTAVFNAKNEWKRHATTQHFQLGFWRCDQCTHPPSRPNDFNRKDLYIQHVRRMHPPTAAAMPSNDKRNTNTKRSGSQSKVDAVEVVLNEAAGRCYQRMRSAPESCCCVFCDEEFEGETALESRLEHVGKHMEKQRKVGLEPVAVQDWREDEELEAWLLHHGLLVRRRGRLEVSK